MEFDPQTAYRLRLYLCTEVIWLARFQENSESPSILEKCARTSHLQSPSPHTRRRFMHFLAPAKGVTNHPKAEVAKGTSAPVSLCKGQLSHRSMLNIRISTGSMMTCMIVSDDARYDDNSRSVFWLLAYLYGRVCNQCARFDSGKRTESSLTVFEHLDIPL